jgi:hypothetical protein
MDRWTWTRAGMAAAALALAAPALAQESLPVTTPAAATPDAAPVRPDGMADSFVAPPVDATGAYVTPNRGLTAAEATWHLRVALNVAALNCRDAQEAATVAGYNAFLAERRDALAAAGEGMAAAYRTRFGAQWQAQHDDAMTRLYNFWAQPPAHAGFCTSAQAVLRELATVEPDGFTPYAAAALARLEAPFVVAYAAADRYHADVAAWRARHAPAVIVASAAVVPVAGVVEH